MKLKFAETVVTKSEIIIYSFAEKWVTITREWSLIAEFCQPEFPAKLNLFSQKLFPTTRKSKNDSTSSHRNIRNRTSGFQKTLIHPDLIPPDIDQEQPSTATQFFGKFVTPPLAYISLLSLITLRDAKEASLASLSSRARSVNRPPPSLSLERTATMRANRKTRDFVENGNDETQRTLLQQHVYRLLHSSAGENENANFEQEATTV